MKRSKVEHILIIGGGVGGALAHDLALRGFRVTLVEKGELLSGTTGRHHGLLHSGARYVLHDLETAGECWEENQILRRLVPQAIEPNGGLFVAQNADDLAWRERFLDGCRTAGIPAREIPVRQALGLVPALHPRIKAAIQVPDASMDAWRLALPFFATARANGALIRPYCEVTALVCNGKAVSGARITNHLTGATETIGADLVVNAAGPWAGRIAAMAGVQVPIQPAPGVMLSIPGRLTHMVINRLHPAGEGDIIVPQRRQSILGTTAWLADDPDRVAAPDAHVRRLLMLCARLLPAIKELKPNAVWSASRPLLSEFPAPAVDPFVITRTFDCFDHAGRDQVEGFVTLIGGKATTMRAMAEKSADLICRKTGRTLACRTRETALLNYRLNWRQDGSFV